MESRIAKGRSQSPESPGEFETEALQSSLSEQGSTGTVVAMVACNVILLVMLAACSPPAHAQDLAIPARGVDARAHDVAVHVETLTVRPSPEERPAPVKSRLQRVDEVLNAPGSRRYRVVESATNDGIRTACYEPCVNDCCVSSGGRSVTVTGLGFIR